MDCSGYVAYLYSCYGFNENWMRGAGTYLDMLSGDLREELPMNAIERRAFAHEDLFDLNAYDYPLPEERIAQTPAEPRDSSRLLSWDVGSGMVEHRRFRDILEYLRPGDLLVLNDTRVLPARLLGKRLPGGGAVEVLLLSPLNVIILNLM